MYIPKTHEETRIDVLQEFMEAHPFATLVTLGSAGLFATHLPVVLDRDGGTLGILRGHISRANRQWRDFSAVVEALVIFSGPHHYITPNWYAEKAKSGRVVPTWNYAVVHAYARLAVIEDAAWLLKNVQTLTDVHEVGSPAPWRVSDAPEEYIHAIAKGIVGVELTITRLEGKWKVSQNQSAENRAGVVKGLEELGTVESLEMKRLVEEGLK
ncbi:negative transcriptional regulator [Edaphobacter acidisoli]|uniref:Negative transcriptional regulator n=1 Tax=Edaphobacter acidisoli TaxID=2040573 RepID=A0A916RU99_9BACT|nr:FMN-binding negative transcriptional regulator [Edaphobacter acidisoli]GGA67618.1 negative transcriptional regulator [Edaphobacter acidisoli]